MDMTYKSNGSMKVVIAPMAEPKKPKPLKEGASLTDKIIHAIRHVNDPEIPLNVYDLGLIYDVSVDADHNATITMTLTAPNCPVADDIVNDVRNHVAALSEVNNVTVTLVFDPPWTKDMMTDAAKLELGLL